MISFIVEKMLPKRHLALYEKAIAPSATNLPNDHIHLAIWFHHPHPHMITARPIESKHHLNRTCLECGIMCCFLRPFRYFTIPKRFKNRCETKSLTFLSL